MIAELPPAKHADEYTVEERARLTHEAAEAAVLLAAHLQRLVQINEELRRRDGGSP